MTTRPHSYFYRYSLGAEVRIGNHGKPAIIVLCGTDYGGEFYLVEWTDGNEIRSKWFRAGELEPEPF